MIRLLLAFVVLTGSLTVAYGEEILRERKGRWSLSCHYDPAGVGSPACFASTAQGITIQVHPDKFYLWFDDKRWRVKDGKIYKLWIYLDGKHTSPLTSMKCEGFNFEAEGGYKCLMRMNFNNLEVLRKSKSIGVNAGENHQKWYSLKGSAKALDWVLDKVSEMAHAYPYEKGGLDG